MRRSLRPLSSRRPARAHVTADQLAALSHEFRTPLNGVLGMARLLEATDLTAEQHTYATALRESGQHLLTLVNDLLDFAKLGAGRSDLNLAPVDLEDTLRSVCELMSPRASEKGLEFGWAAPAGLPRIRADESRLKQILLNFIGNAVKFTAKGGVLAAISELDDGRLRFTVEDTGPGVPVEDRERIFEAFAQVGGAQADLSGAGLGLAIARRLAHNMGGDVGVEAGPHGGALFWFEAEFERLSTPLRERPLAGRTVGVLSPNLIIREAADLQLRACGAGAVDATSMAELVARTHPGDAVLIDHAMGDGAPVRPPRDRAAIVLLSPADRGKLEAYRAAGYAGYLIKPLRRASLAARVAIAAAGHGDNAETEDERIAEAAAPGAKVLLVEDNPVNALLARALLAREGCTVDHACGGEEAIAAARVGVYDIILMDMRMPDLSGEQTARRLRADKVTTPIIALTANVFEDDRQACLAAGMNDFLVKPLAPETLRSMLVRWIGERWTQPAARAKVG